MKKTIALIILLIGLVSGLMYFLAGKVAHPEKVILGSWKEVSWKYAKADIKGPKHFRDLPMHHQVKMAISEGLVIHQSEKWLFKKDGTLTLYRKNDEPVVVQWKLKGRGHILQLKYDANTVENYNIYELDRKKMILHFENDTHARGIVKIEFKRV